MRPPAMADVDNTINPFVDAARAHGIDHVVFLSVTGAGKKRLVPHRRVEDHLRARRVRQSIRRSRSFWADRVAACVSTSPITLIGGRSQRAQARAGMPNATWIAPALPSLRYR